MLNGKMREANMCGVIHFAFRPWRNVWIGIYQAYVYSHDIFIGVSSLTFPFSHFPSFISSPLLSAPF